MSESRPTSSVTSHRPSLAYVSSLFPTRSETFVYREVRALRQLKLDVACVTLRPSQAVPAGADDLLAGLLTVYDETLAARLLREVLHHPARSADTLLRAGLDALRPGEPTSWRGRMGLLAQAGAALALAESLREREVTHVHAHFAHAPASIAMYAARQLKIRFSFTGHANDIFERRCLLRKKLARASFVGCISEWHLAFYEREVPRARNQYDVIRCGVDTTRWRPADRHRSPSAPLRVVTVCRLVPKKGIDTLIRAVAECTAPLRVEIAGDGPEEDALRSLARELGVEDRVNFLGPVENERARELVQRADVFALPCRTDLRGDKDGIPVALMEAMACGLTVISGDLPAIRELITHGESGFLVQPDDPGVLAGVLDQVAQSDQKSIRQKARERIESEFSLAQNVARLVERFGAKLPEQETSCDGSVAGRRDLRRNAGGERVDERATAG